MNIALMIFEIKKNNKKQQVKFIINLINAIYLLDKSNKNGVSMPTEYYMKN